MYRDLKGKAALITGAGKKTGIGYAIARKLAENGSNIIIADLVKKEGEDNPLITQEWNELAGLAEGLKESFGIETLAVDLDVMRSGSVEEMGRVVTDRFGHLDIVCNNAGSVFGVPNAVHAYDEEAWLRTIDVNLNGAFRVSKATVPLMMGRPGSIINVASQAGKKPPLFNGAYAVSKAGLIMMTKVMALELAGAGIRVNAICPGVIQTDFTKWRFDLEAHFLSSTPEERIEEKCKEIPVGRLGTVEEVANLVAFLASDQSSYITGQALNINGGQLMEL
ncbi:MAG: SDR family NAD(P)-dependent oxidoreductase [Pseudomonadota bacterium]